MTKNAKPLTERQEKYVRALASGMPSQEAALQAGFTRSYARVAATRLLAVPAVRTAIDEIKAEARKMAVYDLARAMAEAKEAIEFAKANKNAMAYAKLVEHRARLSGLLIERIHIETVDVRGALEEARARIRIINPTMPELPPIRRGADELDPFTK